MCQKHTSNEVPVNIKVTNQSVVHHMSENNHGKKKKTKKLSESEINRKTEG